MNATAVVAIAKKYCYDLEGVVDIYPFSSLYLAEIRGQNKLSASCFRRITLAKVFSDSLKENRCESLLRLGADLTDGAGRPKSTRILRLANVQGNLLQSCAA